MQLKSKPGETLSAMIFSFTTLFTIFQRYGFRTAFSKTAEAFHVDISILRSYVYILKANESFSEWIKVTWFRNHVFSTSCYVILTTQTLRGYIIKGRPKRLALKSKPGETLSAMKFSFTTLFTIFQRYGFRTAFSKTAEAFHVDISILRSYVYILKANESFSEWIKVTWFRNLTYFRNITYPGYINKAFCS